MVGLTNSYQSDFFLDKDFTFTEKNFTEWEIGRSLYLHFYLDRSLHEVTMEPDSVFSVFAKMGALLGLLRIFTFINVFHEWQFERRLARELGGKVKTGSANINES